MPVKCVKETDETQLSKIVNPHDKGAARPSALSNIEQKMSCETLIRAVSRGNCVGLGQLKGLMRQISSDEGDGY